MIDLTPLEVRQKKGDFRTSFRGYDGELVNDFLDLVADRMEELVRENMELSDRVESLEDELEAYRTKERALSEALMAAQKLQEDARSHADKEGELMIREARMAAESARQEASKALAREEEALRRVRARRGQLVESFRRLLERELSELAVIEETLELQAPAESEGEASVSARPEPRVATAEPEDGAGGEPEAGAGGEAVEVEPKEPRLELTADLPGSERSSKPAKSKPDQAASPGEGEPAGADEDEDEVQEDWLKSLVEE